MSALDTSVLVAVPVGKPLLFTLVLRHAVI